jgi:lysine 6-dehydrogenase
MRNKMQALVVGGAGIIGQAVARALIKQEQVKKVILGDIITDSSRLHDKLRTSEKVLLSKIDLNDHEVLVREIKDVDVVINCAGPFYRTAITVSKAAVEARVNYIDVCDDYEVIGYLFDSEIDSAAKEAGITVLTGMGSDPGTNNLIAKYYANQLERVDEIALFWVVSIPEIEGGAAWDHSLHMNTGKIPQYLDGKLEYIEAGTGEETVEFPEPLGTCQVHYVGHPQPLTMPRYIEGVKRVTIKGGLLPPWVNQLIKDQNATGFLSIAPMEIKGVKIAPYDLTLQLWRTIPENRDKGPASSGIKVIVRGKREGKQVTYTSDMVGHLAPGTGIPPSIAALLLYAGDIKVKGVTAPEGCIDPEKYLVAFQERGAQIYQTETITSVLGP